jgi:hypothetical protein
MVIMAAFIVFHMKKESMAQKRSLKGVIQKISQCGRRGYFFKDHYITGPVTIDLSQKKYKGIVLYYGKGLQKVYHPKSWERFEYFSTYAVDKEGNLYLVPMPYISIHPTTFNLLSNLYRIDTYTGALSVFMHFDDIKPSPNNPYGLNAITYDCDDDTLWVSTIDQSDYKTQRGVLYHIDPKHKKILQRIEGWDALSLSLMKTDKEKFLLMGSARDSGLYAFKIKDAKIVGNPKKLFEITNAEEHIRKIKIKDINHLEVQTIPFSYTLIAQSSKKDRLIYDVYYRNQEWKIIRRK